MIVANINKYPPQFLEGFPNAFEKYKFILFDTMMDFGDNWASFPQLCRGAFGSRSKISNMDAVREAIEDLVRSGCLIERRGQFRVRYFNLENSHEVFR